MKPRLCCRCEEAGGNDHAVQTPERHSDRSSLEASASRRSHSHFATAQLQLPTSSLVWFEVARLRDSAETANRFVGLWFHPPWRGVVVVHEIHSAATKTSGLTKSNV